MAWRLSALTTGPARALAVPARILLNSCRNSKSLPDDSKLPRFPPRIDVYPIATLGPFDGKVAVLAHIAAEHYFIMTNADYVPDIPSIKLPHTVFLWSDMQYGTDDPTLWPQQWTARYCHLPVIAKKGTRPDLDVMWWDPSPVDFVVGSTITRGLGRLHWTAMSRFTPVINELVSKCKELRRTSATPISPLLGELIQNILMWAEQLQTLPTTYDKMVFGVTSLQRGCLELDALYNYMTIYKPQIDNLSRFDANLIVPTILKSTCHGCQEFIDAKGSAQGITGQDDA
ncbi:hypothetical protein C8R44DRAFT_866829 [Mycena epipterygia]|nr:hypothetical protein C8R44DRAFT_866829 [Mycena epipterygia]